jgi:hypothetical protein
MTQLQQYLDTHKLVRERLINYMKDKHYSNAFCANVMGIYYFTFRNFLLEKRLPRLKTLSKIDSFLKQEGY